MYLFTPLRKVEEPVQRCTSPQLKERILHRLVQLLYSKMNIVIDTSAVLAVLLNEDSKNRILSLTKGQSLIAPQSLNAEIGNALSAMFKRERINLSLANKVISQFELIPIRKTELQLEHSIDLCKKLNIYAYDAYMLSCLINFKGTLLSLDQTLIQHAKNFGLNILEV
ncbi:MAG: type II toxin-antitoxin system VapC family toxin [Balneolaceae bacterium]